MSINISLLLWIAVALVLAWAVGAYSRLTRQRDQAVRARASLLKHLHAGRNLLSEMEASRREDAPLTDPHRASLLLAAQKLQQQTAQWERQSNGALVPPDLGAAIDALVQGVAAMAAAPGDLAGDLWPAETAERWREHAQDVQARRTRYNVHVAELEEALSQMPAALLARVLGFTVWERI